ncbi:DUF2953 domain-containing protein [Oceanobacillus halophilus]|uniref:DUF2953 domain-containing protein n=1 Tax=Oceanobacillus halophilus TaxID=930130 RepID=UPI0013145CDC|nr:DUF2953 domain-containing protein [Oceanobacillus halophilus]
MLLISLLLILLFIFTLFLKIYVTVNYSFKDYEQQLNVSISVYKFKIVNREIQLDELEERSFVQDFDFGSLSNEDSIVTTIRKVTRALNAILNKTKLHKLNWSSLIGTGEASSTGVVSGALWALKGTLIGIFAEKLILECKPKVEVNPRYQQEYVQTNLDCMVSIRIGKAIQALIKVRKTFKQ